MIRSFLNIFKGAVVLLLFFSNAVASQNVVVTDSIKTAFLPALSFNSDFGFLAGGLLQKFHYKQHTQPFYSFTRIAAIASTKGLASALIEHDKPYAFGRGLRFKNQFYISRFFQDSFYGVGSYGKINDSFNASTDLFTFQSFSFGLNSELRIPVRAGHKNSLDILAILNFDYETPWDNDANSLISQQEPLGEQGGRTVHIGTGFIWENRNSEFRPTRGNYAESSIEIGQTWYGSSYNTLVFKAEARQYLSFFLIREITWANRVFAKNTSGEVPYWKLAHAGDEESLRGYPSRRFMDDNVILLNTELRTWLFKIKPIKGEFGGTLFFDVGRTYSNGDSFNTVFNDLKYSGGLGGTSSFFTSDFIMRIDVGFSEEGTGVYFTAGYMF